MLSLILPRASSVIHSKLRSRARKYKSTQNIEPLKLALVTALAKRVDVDSTEMFIKPPGTDVSTLVRLYIQQLPGAKRESSLSTTSGVFIAQRQKSLVT